MNLRSLPQLPHRVHRIGEIVDVLAKYGLAGWLSHTEFERPKKFFTGKGGELLAEESHATRIRLAITELGTTYIKFGQMLSTRPDLVGPEVADELAKLQQGVPPDPPEVALATVAAELGRPVKTVFPEFDPTPIGSASIGQVHAAQLPDGRGATIWMEMIFRDGFFHADPHPGNLLVLPGGIIGILDSGMVGRIDESMRESIEECLIAVANHDSAQLTRLLLQLCSAPPGVDQAAFGSDVADYLGFYGNQPIEHFQLGGALNEMVRILTHFQLILPSGVSRLIRTFVMLEGTAELLSPTVNLLKLIKSYERKILLRRHSPHAQWQKWRRLLGEWRHFGESLPRGLDEVLSKIQSGKFDINLEHRRLEPSVNRLVMGMITSALFLGSALLWSNQVPPVAGGFSLVGVLGYVLSVVLGWRLLRKIWRD